MAKLSCMVVVLLLAWCGIALSRPMAPMAATPSPKAMPVPCYLKIYNGFCFTSKDKDSCTFYANPSYATFKQCVEDPNMGKTTKCAEVSADLKDRFADNYKTCVDKEVLTGSSGGGSAAAPNWSKVDNVDVPGKDIPSNGKAFTEVCQGEDQVKEQCAKTNGCAGFTYNGKCGYLKASAGETKGRSGWAVFVIKK